MLFPDSVSEILKKRLGFVYAIVIIGVSLALAMLVQAPHLFGSRVHDNLDFAFHYNYALEYADAFRSGDLWPRWSHKAWNGLGEPGLLYYAPLYYWLSAALQMVTGNTWTAMQLVEIASATLAACFCYRLAAEYAGRNTALLAVPLIVLSPMLVQLHHGFNGYPWATAVAPLAVLQWAMLRRNLPAGAWNPLAVAALAATIYTHTITGLMAVIMVASLAIPAALRWALRHRPSVAELQPVTTAILGLLLSAAYLLPAIGLQGEVDAQTWLRDYSPFNAFALPTFTAITQGMRWFAFQWPISLLIVAGAATALLALRNSDLPKTARWAFASAFGVATFLATEISAPIWAINSPLLNVQFPYRFLTVLAPLTAVLLPIAIDKSRAVGTVARLSLYGLVSANIGLGGLILTKAAFVDGAPVDTRDSSFTPYVGHGEYRTRYAMEGVTKPDDLSLVSECSKGTLICTPSIRSGSGRIWSVEVMHAGQVRLPLYFFPGWKTQVDGQDVPNRPDSVTGLMQVALSKGQHRVETHWSMMQLERIGFIVSLLTAQVLLLLFWLPKRGARGVAPRPNLGGPRRVALHAASS